MEALNSNFYILHRERNLTKAYLTAEKVPTGFGSSNQPSLRKGEVLYSLDICSFQRRHSGFPL